MLQNIQNYIQSEQLFNENQKVLVAVSGGIDSVVLCHLLFDLGYNFGMAHCNFQLRGEESDEDADFVRQLAKNFNVEYFETSFDTSSISHQQKQSIQVVARELRYEWLENIRKTHEYEVIATAHHLNDSIETVIYNLTKGTGIHGLHGVLPKNGNIVRPLLFAQKSEIEQYVLDYQITYREDSSNASDKYARNHIRHYIVPTLKEINPSLEKTFDKNIQRFRAIESLYQWAIDYWKPKILIKKGLQYIISVNALKEVPALPTVLYEILKPFGFNGIQIQQLLSNSMISSGKIISSHTHDLITNRYHWIIQRTSIKTDKEKILVVNFQERVILNQQESVSFQLKDKVTFNQNPNLAYFDADKLQFPIQFRKWKIGDIFQPFGMNGKHKRVSDIFSNAKLSLFEKEKIWLMESGGEIAWIVGMRSDERFRVTASTKKIMVAELHSN